jgi:hypothetical protein
LFESAVFPAGHAVTQESPSRNLLALEESHESHFAGSTVQVLQFEAVQATHLLFESAVFPVEHVVTQESPSRNLLAVEESQESHFAESAVQVLQFEAVQATHLLAALAGFPVGHAVTQESPSRNLLAVEESQESHFAGSAVQVLQFEAVQATHLLAALAGFPVGHAVTQESPSRNLLAVEESQESHFARSTVQVLQFEAVQATHLLFESADFPVEHAVTQESPSRNLLAVDESQESHFAGSTAQVLQFEAVQATHLLFESAVFPVGHAVTQESPSRNLLAVEESQESHFAGSAVQVLQFEAVQATHLLAALAGFPVGHAVTQESPSRNLLAVEESQESHFAGSTVQVLQF